MYIRYERAGACGLFQGAVLILACGTEENH